MMHDMEPTLKEGRDTRAIPTAASEPPTPPLALSVVIPVYNSQDTLMPLCERLGRALDGLERSYEVVLVNDASRDGSWEVIRALRHHYPWVRAIDLMRNYGQQNALLCGVRAARGTVIVTMDDDLQHPPEEIGKLLRRLDDGYDVVYGTSRELPHSLARNLASRLTKIALQTVMGAETARQVSAFRAFRSSVRGAFERFSNTFVSLDVLLTWGTQRFGAVDVRHEPRASGHSNYTFRMLVQHALNMLTGFSVRPLQLASLVGFLFTLFGAGVLAYVLIRYLVNGGSLPGFPFIASIIAIFSGAQLFALGIIGEYIARIHTRTMERPSYVVRESLAAVSTSPPLQEPLAGQVGATVRGG